MTAKRKRLEALEAAHAARTARRAGLTQPGPDALHELARRVCLALPEDLQAHVKARGARGLAELLEAYWEAGNPGAGEDLAVSALAAFRLAFPGVGA